MTDERVINLPRARERLPMIVGDAWKDWSDEMVGAAVYVLDVLDTENEQLREAGNRLARTVHEAATLMDAEWMSCESPPCPYWRDALHAWNEASRQGGDGDHAE